MTDRKLASIRKIGAIEPIEGADAIEVAKVDGWRVVVKKGQFSAGDMIIFCEVDGWIPETVAPFLSKGREFNGVKGERLRTVKLKGQLSQGLVLPVPVELSDARCGDDVTERLGIQKWEKPVSAQIAGQTKGSFPCFIRKTHQDRCQNLTREIMDSFNRMDRYEITIKLDGSSMTVYCNNGEVGVCSHNVDLKINEENASNSFIATANESGLIEALKEYCARSGSNIAVQGELMGAGIQGNRENLKKHQVFVFDIYDIDRGEYMTPMERRMVVQSLKCLGFSGEHCPVLYDDYMFPSGNVDKILELADGPSLNHPVREGLVFKRMDGKFSFKAISNRFLLKEKD